jgi:hypothetical protein
MKNAKKQLIFAKFVKRRRLVGRNMIALKHLSKN